MLAPILAAPAVVQVHLLSALAALGLGGALLARVKGRRRHRVMGWGWIALMAVVALSSFWITGRAGKGHWSWIHGLSGMVLVLLPLGWIAARRHRVGSHRRTMLALFFGALVVTGAFTLMPGRLLGRALLGW